ncbi:MAG: glycosyltransferase family 39 protein [Chitinophagaceae bacterium]
MWRGIIAFIRKNHVSLFFFTWFLLSLIQAYGTELIDDEAYYWVYSKYPAWGYFDHPPMIAILIRSGYAMFHNEFGLRLWMSVLSTCTLVLIYRLIPRKNDGLFYAIACTICLLQIGGILAVPDLPLMFFAALFFIAYEKFTRNMSYGNATFLGVVMALLLYTKYHGILIIVFTFFSNPVLAIKFKAYLAAGIGALLFLPHLYWQYTHGFPSVQYHLLGRNASEYQFGFTLQYLLGQLLLPGPLTGWLLLWAAFKYRATNELERSLKFCMAGIYIFFLASTIKGRVEANWTLPALIPLIVLSHQYLINKEQWKRILIWFVPVNLLLIFFMRLYMLFNMAPLKFMSKDEFHKNQQWAESIYKKTQGLPVVFINSYQKASKYWFYSGVPSFSLNTPFYRRNNYNYWPVEDSLFGKRVAAISGYAYDYYKDRMETVKGTTGLLIVDSFYSFSKLQIITLKNPVSINEKISGCRLHILTPISYLETFQTSRFLNSTVDLLVFTTETKTRNFSTGIRLADISKPAQDIVCSFKLDLPRGEYMACFSLPTSLVIDPSLNSTLFKLLVR